MCSLDRSGEHGKAVLRTPLSTISCVGLPYNCALFLEQKSHSGVFEALPHPMRNDSILSTPDVSFVRLFWSQGNPRIPSVTLRADLPLYLPGPVCWCLLEHLKYERQSKLPPYRKKVQTPRRRAQIGLPRMVADAHSAHSAHSIARAAQ
jgi:hypothetical protein